nr:unnamed protein product [Digitaria exilis]
MSFSDAVQWWEEWQLRVRVLTSLFIQFFLSYSAPLRKYRIPPWFRFFIWLAYLGGDAMAIYALASLFNRHKTGGAVSKQSHSTGLEALWAPILLVHLGGKDSITAYNVEDNELWRRHVLTALSQPWALKNASINSLVSSSSTNEDDNAGDISSLENIVQAATEYLRAGLENQQPPEQIVGDKPYDIFIDIAPPFSERLNNLKCMVHANGNEAHRLLKSGLSRAFDRLYNKDQVSPGYLARNRKHSWFRKLATLLVCKDYLDQLWCMKPCKSSSDITAIVHDHVRDAWKKHVIVDVSTYRDFHDIRGQWALERWGLLDILGPSLQRPFDESVLLWHLATDFCFYSTDASCTSSSHSQHTIAARDLSRKISNYMMYLLFVNPEMLMAGARRNLFRAAYCELKDLLKDNEGPPLNARKLTGKIVEDLKKVSCPQEQTPSASRQHFVPCAYWEVAKPLLSIKDEEKMWLAIQGVWVEMLCFSARRCRGYLHAKSLGKGGEYLSYVWLLQLYMGMETSAEILQRTRLQQEGTASATPTRPTNTVGDNNV